MYPGKNASPTKKVTLLVEDTDANWKEEQVFDKSALKSGFESQDSNNTQTALKIEKEDSEPGNEASYGNMMRQLEK